MAAKAAICAKPSCHFLNYKVLASYVDSYLLTETLPPSRLSVLKIPRFAMLQFKFEAPASILKTGKRPSQCTEARTLQNASN